MKLVIINLAIWESVMTVGLIATIISKHILLRHTEPSSQTPGPHFQDRLNCKMYAQSHQTAGSGRSILPLIMIKLLFFI